MNFNDNTDTKKKNLSGHVSNSNPSKFQIIMFFCTNSDKIMKLINYIINAR